MRKWCLLAVCCLLIVAEPLLAQSDLEGFENQVVKPLIEKRMSTAESMTGTVEANIENWADWDPLDTPFMFGNLAPGVNWELDYSWLSGNIPPSVEQQLGAFTSQIPGEVPIPYTNYSTGYPEIVTGYVSGLDLASQTAQCNRINFPFTHLHTYEALRTPPVEYDSWPNINSWVRWDAPVGMGVPPIEYIDEYLAAIDYAADLTPTKCCASLKIKWTWRGPRIRCAEEHVCVQTKEYQPLRYGQLGFPAGWCGNVDTTPPGKVGINFPQYGVNIFETCCPLKARFGHVVDYYYPTQKISMSRQPFHSRYIDIQDVVDVNGGQLLALRDSLHDYSRDGEAALTEIKEIHKKQKLQAYNSLGETLCKLSPNCSYAIPDNDPLNYPWDPPAIGTLARPNNLFALIAARSQLSSFTDQLRTLMFFSRGENDRGFIRFFPEKQVEEDIESQHYAPHVYPENDGVVGQPFYATDHRFDPTELEIAGETVSPRAGFELAYWLHHSAEYDPTFEHYQSPDDWDVTKPHPSAPHLDHPERCPRQNAQTGRTPVELLTAICPEENDLCKEEWSARYDPVGQQPNIDFSNVRCLEDVGEIVQTATTRSHNTDYIFQTLTKGYQQYHHRFPHGTKSISLDLQKDRFHIFPSKKLSEIDPTNLQDIGALWRGSAFLNEAFPAELNKNLNEDIDQSAGGLIGLIPFLNSRLAGGCNKFGDLVSDEGGRKNWSFEKSNIIDKDVVGGHAETTMEAFTLFSGCYGWPGVEDWNLDIFDVFNMDFILRIWPSEFGPTGALRIK